MAKMQDRDFECWQEHGAVDNLTRDGGSIF